MRILNATEVAAWVRDDLLSPARRLPIVAVTTRPHDGGSWLDLGALDDAIGALADIVVLETGDATWELADALPPRLDAYGGAVRIWWPGLTVTSNPYDHRLHFVRSPMEAKLVFDEIVAAVRERVRNSSAEQAPVVEARVTSVKGSVIQLVAGNLRGPLSFADIELTDLGRGLETGTTLSVRVIHAQDAERAEFSVQGLLPTPWERAGLELAVGDVVIGRVQNIVDYGAFFDILPKVAGLAHKSEIDWTFVDDVSRFVRPDQLVPVQIVRIDSSERRMELSIKRAIGAVPRPLPSLVPGGKPFEWEGLVSAPVAHPQASESAERMLEMTQELDELAGDRGRLAEQNKQLREQNQDLRKELRSLKDRFYLWERRIALEADPLADERAFVRAVRVTYARMFDEDDRCQHPLLRMRVGPQFLDSLRALEGTDIDKVLEVCAQVASDVVHTVVSREMHQLRAGRAGQPRVRSSDQAQAWRCAVQVKSPSARRLHWWRVTGAAGSTIEFAGADVHDEFGIAE